MVAREANELINSLSPSEQESLLEKIRIRVATNNLTGKPIHDAHLMKFVRSRLVGEECEVLRHRVSHPGNGKVVVIKGGI